MTCATGEIAHLKELLDVELLTVKLERDFGVKGLFIRSIEVAIIVDMHRACLNLEKLLHKQFSSSNF